MKRKTEILVIGGGAIGICSAFYLNAQGRGVTVIEKGDICSGSSYGNAGMIVPSHSVPLAAPGVIAKGIKWMFNPESPFYIKPRFNLALLSWLWEFRKACSKNRMHRAIPVIRELNMASLKLFEALADTEGLEFGFKQKGMLSVFITDKGYKEGIEEANLMRQNGIDVSILGADEIKNYAGGAKLTVVGGVFYPQDANITPHRFVRGMASYLQGKGVVIHESTEVLGFDVTGPNITTVKTTRGDFTADTVVMASGAWSPAIAQDLKLNIPIQPAKGYSITYKRPAICPSVPIGLAEAKMIITPMDNTMRFAGTLELAGLDLTINKRRVRAILNNVPKYIPAMKPDALELIEIWRGLRPCTPDGLPFIGRPKNYENLLIAAGHAMIGMSLSPITGKLVSQLAANEMPQIDVSPLRLERFH